MLRASTNAYLPVGRRVRLAGSGWADFNYFASEDDQGSTARRVASSSTPVGGGGGFHARQLGEAFILISTTRRCGPTSVMGATKRVAELVVQNLGRRFATRYVAGSGTCSAPRGR